MKKLCALCGKQKAKRTCFLREGAGICPSCCASTRTDKCEGCSYYSASQEYQQQKYKNTGDRKFILELKPELEEELNRALELIDSGRMIEAEKIINEVARTDPQYYLLDFARGTVYIKQEMLDEAIACFDRATEKFPYFMEAHFNKGMAYKQKFDIPNMVRTFKEVLKTGNFDDENVRWARDFIKDMERNIRETDGVSLDTYVKAYDVFNEAFACMNREQWEKAVGLFKQCISLNPRNPKSYGNIGICYAKLGRKQEALDALDKSLELDPNYEPAMLNRIGISELEDGKALPGGPVATVDYSKDYGVKKKSLIQTVYDKILAKRDH